jgi:transcription elongation GreA/GreB family factor
VKKDLLAQLKNNLLEQLQELQAAARSTKEFATDQEFKAESKYDTRALEASYLASAETQRVEDLKLELQMLDEIDLETREDISVGALVELIYQGQLRSYFLIPTAGGTILNFQNKTVLVVSVFSPLGAQLLGLKAGDEFEVEGPKDIRHYKVASFI